MVKTLRISDDKIHTELLRIQGKMQAEEGVIISMEDVIKELVQDYKLHNRSLKKW